MESDQHRHKADAWTWLRLLRQWQASRTRKTVRQPSRIVTPWSR